MKERLSAIAPLLLLAAACASTPQPAPAAPSAPTSSAAAPAICSATVARTWHGRVPNARAGEYTTYISEAITKFRGIAGNRGYQLMKEQIGEETHFTVISYWDARASISAYAGEDITKTRHLPRDAEFLIEPEATVKNYELVVNDIDCPKPGQ